MPYDAPVTSAVCPVPGRVAVMSRSFGKHLARAAEVLREVLELRETVAHGYHLLAVMDVQRRLVRQALHGTRRHVGHAEARMADQHRASAGGAELPVAVLGLLERAELVRAFEHVHVRRRPQGRGVN